MVRLIVVVSALLLCSRLVAQKLTPAEIDFHKYHATLQKSKPDSLIILFTGFYNHELKMSEGINIICVSVKNALYQIVSFNDFEPIRRIPSFDCDIFKLFKTYEPKIRIVNMRGMPRKKEQKKFLKQLKPVEYETLIVETKGFAGHYRIYDKKYNYFGQPVDTTTVYPALRQFVDSVKSLVK